MFLALNRRGRHVVAMPSLLMLFLSLQPASTQQFLETPPPVVRVNETDSVTVSCSFTDPSELFWEFQGERISASNGAFSLGSPASGNITLTVSAADHGIHTGMYACVAMESSVRFSTDFQITVQYLDSVVQIRLINDRCSPPGIIVINTNISLECTASGEPFPRIAWFKGSRNQPQERIKIRQMDSTRINFDNNKRILRISDIMHSDADLYHCEATNEVTAISSMDLDIRVQTVVATTVSLVNVSDTVFVMESAEASLTCHITPAPTSSIQWDLSGSPLTSGVGGIALFSEPCDFILRIQQVAPTHEGSYTCRVDNAMASTRLTIARLNSRYEVRSSSGSFTIGRGRGIQMECIGTGNPGNVDNIAISWRVDSGDGVRAVMSDGVRVWVGGRWLNFTSTELSDAGSYTCVVSHQLTPDSTTTVALTVEESPMALIAPAVANVQLGVPLTLTCTISPADRRDVAFFWELDDNRLTPSNRISQNNTGSRSYLIISQPMASDLGSYRCVAEDPLHVPVAATAQVMEQEALYFIGGSSMVELDLEAGRNVPLSCDVRGLAREATSVSWFRGNREIVAGNSDRESIERFSNGSSVLTLFDVVLTDEATYHCLVTDPGQGESISLRIEATVIIPGMIIRYPPPIVNGSAGQPLRLDCEAIGKPPPLVVWLRNTQMVMNIDDDQLQDLGNGSLVFNPLAPEHSDSYHCYIIDGFMIKDTFVRVVPFQGASGSFGSLSLEEGILVICVSVVIALLLGFTFLLCLCVCCYSSRLSKLHSDLSRDEADGEFKRQPSIRKDNSGILSASPTNHIFDTLQRSASPPNTASFTTGTPRQHHPEPTFIPLNDYNTDGASNSVLSETTGGRSPSPTTLGTQASTSLYSADDRTSVTTNLPNFPRENLQLGSVIGEGEFGPVLLGLASGIVAHEEQTSVVVKVLLPRGEDEGISPDVALVDFANQMKLEYTNIVSILGICSDLEPFYVIYEYPDQGDLKKFLIRTRPKQGSLTLLKLPNMHKMILQVADGMAYLFSQRIIHGDLAARNCLISSNLNVKIAELGIGHDLYSGDYYDNGTQLLPIRWMPPELLEESEDGPSFSLHSDIWSFGVFCWEVFSFARLPYDHLSDEELLMAVVKGTRLPPPLEGCPPAIFGIMNECWEEVAELRPSFVHLCSAIHNVELTR